MPAPRRPNTANATVAAAAAAHGRALERKAGELRKAGWLVFAPEAATDPALIGAVAAAFAAGAGPCGHQPDIADNVGCSHCLAAIAVTTIFGRDEDRP